MSHFNEGLYFNFNKYNFWPYIIAFQNSILSACGKKMMKCIVRTPESKQWKALIEEHFHENEKRNGRTSVHRYRQKIEHLVIGTTYGQASCYSLYIELEQAMVSDMTRFKELHCFVSLWGAVLHNNWPGQK